MTMQLVLASASPRRAELLSLAGLSFEIDAPSLEEAALPGERPRAYVERLAAAKAEEVASRWPGAWILAADTVVALGPDILEKPRDRDDARRMLQALQGRSHEVFTGVAIQGPAHRDVFSECTEVRFRRLHDMEIEAYLASGEADDKAGSYGIQGRAAAFVESVTGSYTNVVGLPLAQCLERLCAAGFAPPRP